MTEKILTSNDQKIYDTGKKSGMRVSYAMADKLIHVDNSSEYNQALQDLKSEITKECWRLDYDTE